MSEECKENIEMQDTESYAEDLEYPLWQLGCDECESYNTSACYSCVYWDGE